MLCIIFHSFCISKQKLVTPIAPHNINHSNLELPWLQKTIYPSYLCLEALITEDLQNALNSHIHRLWYDKQRLPPEN